METTAIPAAFYEFTEEQALSIFPTLLRAHLPRSNAIYTRLLCPLNTKDRHCLYAATFPPFALGGLHPHHTVLFADRSRPLESQVWLFNPLTAESSTLGAEEEQLLHFVEKTLRFIKSVKTPEGLPPYSNALKFASIHENFALPLIKLANRREAEIYGSLWNHWVIELSCLVESFQGDFAQHDRQKKDPWTVSRVPENKLEQVIKNSAIRRQKETLKRQASVCLMDEKGGMVAWAFIGLDGSLCTLHVETEWRGKGLAKRVARELLHRYAQGEYADLGLGVEEKRTGWVHAEVGEGNAGSEGVMRALGGKKQLRTGYIGFDLDKL